MGRRVNTTDVVNLCAARKSNWSRSGKKYSINEVQHEWDNNRVHGINQCLHQSVSWYEVKKEKIFWGHWIMDSYVVLHDIHWFENFNQFSSFSCTSVDTYHGSANNDTSSTCDNHSASNKWKWSQGLFEQVSLVYKMKFINFHFSFLRFIICKSHV